MPYRPTFDRVFTLELIIAAAVFALVVILFAVALVRGRKGDPSQRSEWKRLEWSYVMALVAVAGFIVWLSLSANTDEHRTSGPPQLVIHVTAFQWCWRFGYPATHITVTGSCVGGRDLPTMVVPTNTSVEIDLTSSDVIHEFWVPYLRFKQEALPNWSNSFRMTLSSTGRWIGRCSEFCGLLHSDMDFYLLAVTPAQYRHWASVHHGAILT